MSASSERHQQTLFLVGAALAGFLALPRVMFPLAWTAALALPAAALVALGALPDRRWVTDRTRLALAALLQIACAWFAFTSEGALRKEAALTSVLLPPLVYMVLRRRGSDALLALFLSLCLLLIGTMLQPAAALTPCLAFVLTAALALDAQGALLLREHRFAARAGAPSRVARLTARVSVTLAFTLTAAVLFVALRCLPAPSADFGHSRRAEGANASPNVGLSSRFDLSGSPGVPLEIIGEELLLVRPYDARTTVRDDLYLRSTFFDVAGVDRWTLAPIELETVDAFASACRFARPHAQRDEQRLVIERFDESSGLVLVPPGTFEIGGIRALDKNDARAWFHEKSPKGSLEYMVAFQDLAPLAARAELEPAERYLRALPDELATPEIRRLAQELGRNVRRPWLLAQALIAGLQRRCTYALEEPAGRSPHALLRFLFESRRGYCMHFATALAVLLRASDVPCRIAVGLHGGRADPDELGTRRFGQKHAHAWVEIAFKGLGWVVFDPTPPAFLPRERAGDARPASEPAASTDGADSADRALSLFLDLGAGEWPARIGWASAIALVLLLLLRIDFRFARARGAPLPQDVKSARRLLGEILRRLRERGFPRSAGQTLEQLLLTLDARVGERDAIASAFRAYQEIRFGGRAFDDERRAALEQAREALTG